ncbi:hypothetical protein CsSME_00053819 [Camellia sinensis var. sinensis]
MFFSANVPKREATSLSFHVGISITADLGKYLGTPLLHTRVSKSQFTTILEKMAHRLSGGKAKNMSLAGRTTLIKAVTSAMPNHLMQTMELPRKVCDHIDKLNRNFLWGSTDDRRKVHLVNWQQVCKTKKQGGLGIRQARVQNSAFLSKLGWKIATNSNELWCEVLKTKYLKTHSLSNWPTRRQASHTWKSIIKNRDVLDKNIKWHIGTGEQVSL